LRSLHIGGDAVMAGQGDLEATAQRGAVECRNCRLAQGLDGAQLLFDVLDQIEGLSDVLRADLDHALDVTAGEEGLLRGRDNHAGNRIFLSDKAIHRLAHRLDVGLVHDVGRPRRVVQRQRDNAVIVFVPLNGVVGHVLKPSR
jgi:hypothetical protein